MENLGVSKENVQSVLDGESVAVRVKRESLSVRFVLDISDYVASKSLPLCSVCRCVLYFLGEPDQCVDESNFNRMLTKCKNERRKLKKCSKRDGGERLNEFLDGVFDMPGSKCDESVPETEQICGVCAVLQVEKRQLSEHVDQMEVQLKELTAEKMMLKSKLEICEQKVASLNDRNVQRRLRRRDQKIALLEAQVEKKSEELKGEEAEREVQLKQMTECMEKTAKLLEEQKLEQMKADESMEEMKEKLRELRETHKKMSKSLWYYKNGKQVKEEKAMKDLKERVQGLENENDELCVRLEEFMESEEIVCFEGGRYKDDVRQVYQELLGMGVSASKCESIVRSVLEGFGKKVGRLPKETCSKRMILECRALACMQMCEVLDAGTDMTVMSDGTTKFGHHYEAFDVSMNDGNVYTIGVRNVVSGSSECMLSVFQDILGDMYELQGEGSVSERVKETVVRMKNTMGDRAVTEKKFNVMLSEFRREVLPDVVEGWNGMSEQEQNEYGRMNNFFCGMHLLVSLAEQSDVTLKLWEKLVFEENLVGASLVCGVKAGKSESGTVRLVRTVCKGVQDRGCEKSGKPVWFREFVKMMFGHECVPLAPFKGNRFNILFHNGAGVYFLRTELRAFMNEVKDDNLLMKAVNADMNVDQFVAGVRALGIIDKVVTTPLWKVLEMSEHVSGMTERYEKMRECFERWSNDAKTLMNGQESMFDDVVVNKDRVYEKLIEKCELDDMTEQVLEMLCASYEKKLRLLVEDQLRDGVNAADGMNRDETCSVPRTNVACERDFGMLDRMMRERPNVYACALEGLIMYKKNATDEWVKNLDESKVKEVCEKARKSVDEQKKLYMRRKAVIGAERAAKMEKKRYEQERKEQKDHVRAEDLSADVSEYGGFWKNELDMNEWMKENEDDLVRRKAVEAQMKFRKFVLKCKNVNGCLNVTSAGKRKDVCELIEGLRMSMIDSGNERTGVEVMNVFAGKCADESEVNAVKYDYLSEEPKVKRMRTDRNVPFIFDVDDLVGKKVELLTERGVWKKGVVLKVGEMCECGYMHVVKFDGEDEREMFLKEEYKCGALKVVPLSVCDLIGRVIEQKFKDEESGSESWWRARVVDVVNERHGSPDFVVEYEEDMDESEGEWRFKLFDDYKNGDLRLL